MGPTVFGGNLVFDGSCADTEREQHVYQLLAEGSTNMDIADRLDQSLHTVETHCRRIMEAMHLHSAAELVLSAVRRGLAT